MTAACASSVRPSSLQGGLQWAEPATCSDWPRENYGTCPPCLPSITARNTNRRAHSSRHRPSHIARQEPAFRSGRAIPGRQSLLEHLILPCRQARKQRLGPCVARAGASPIEAAAPGGVAAAGSTTRVVVITSGKGGVGKTTATANVGMCLARMGKEVILIDADVGLRNLDLLLGLENRVLYTAMEVLAGECRLEQALVRDKRWPNLSILCCSKNRQRFHLSQDHMRMIVDSLRARGPDFILIDCPAGIDVGFQNAVAPADEAIIVTTPDITAIRDADRVVGLLEAYGYKGIQLMVNKVREDMIVEDKMMSVEDVQEMLCIPFLGAIPEDKEVIVSTNRGEPLVLRRWLTLSGKAFEETTRNLVKGDAGEMGAQLASAPSSLSGSGSLWAAVGLVMGTAVGPGILGLPAAALPAGLIPSSIAIVAAWAYVIASVLLVAEATIQVMRETGAREVSFTGLASRSFGPVGGQLVAVVYAALNYSLLVACIAGLGEIVGKGLGLPPALGCAATTALVGGAVLAAPFPVLDLSNRALCTLMLLSLAALASFGLPHVSLGPALHRTAWPAVLPAIPVMVLTLGFHVITPLVCSVLGGRAAKIRQAILVGGAVPLVMVLAWNTVVLGLAKEASPSVRLDPIALLFSLRNSAAPAVHAFAFAALGTTLLGYALSFPRQLADTAAMLTGRDPTQTGPQPLQGGGPLSLEGSPDNNKDVAPSNNEVAAPGRMGPIAVALTLLPPLVVAATVPAAFASAVQFASIYANCFLFGVIPPLMAWQLRKGADSSADGEKPRSRRDTLLPGGVPVLVALLVVALVLGVFPPRR